VSLRKTRFRIWMRREKEHDGGALGVVGQIHGVGV